MIESARVAIVHDWLTGMRGGERVLEALCELAPRAHIYTLIHIKGSVSPAIEAMEIRSSWLERLPFTPHHFRHYLPLFPAAIESFDLRGYDLVLSSSHCVAKGVVPDPHAVHVAYLHTPMRYAWDLAHEYFHPARMGRLTRLAAPLVANWLRVWDASSNARVDEFVANSAHVRARIQRYYGRTAEVLHPPVDTDYFTPGDGTREHLLVVSALVPYKAIETALEAVRGLDLPLVVAGEGPERARLERQAPANVRFVGAVPREELRRLYRGARAFLLPGEEDFGIAALEAQASGAPVVAYARGGALETVRDGETGTFFTEPSPESLRKAIDRILRTPLKLIDLRDHALRFNRPRFLSEMRALIERALERHRAS